MKLPYILFFFFTFINNNIQPVSGKLQYQTKEKEDIKLLSGGTLIVRLSKCENIIESIKAINGEKESKNEQERIIQANKNLMKEFELNYSFSDVVFAFEVDLYEYLQENKVNVFLNRELEIDPNIKLKEGPIYILSSSTNKLFQLYNDDFSLIDSSAPKYFNNHYQRNYQFAFAEIILSISNIFIKRKTVVNFNKKLFSMMR